MTIAWYDPTNHHVSTDKHDPLFTPLGQVWPLYAKEEWVGLTDELREGAEPMFYCGAKWAERILKEKNT